MWAMRPDISAGPMLRRLSPLRVSLDQAGCSSSAASTAESGKQVISIVSAARVWPSRNLRALRCVMKGASIGQILGALRFAVAR